MRKDRIDMEGARHGRLVGLSFVETGRQHAHWRFRCDCGEITIADEAAVRAGRTTSCGWLHREISAARRSKPTARIRPIPASASSEGGA